MGYTILKPSGNPSELWTPCGCENQFVRHIIALVNNIKKYVTIGEEGLSDKKPGNEALKDFEGPCS